MALPLADKIKPKNNGTFALVDAVDVEMPNGQRLSDYDFSEGNPVFNLTGIIPTVNLPKATVAKSGVDTAEILAALEKGAVTFIIPANYNGVDRIIKITTSGLTSGSAYQCMSAAYLDYQNGLVFVAVFVENKSLQVSVMPISELVDIPDATPVFDLAAMGLSAIPLTGGGTYIATDTAEIRTALANGAVTFVIPFDVGSETLQARITMVGASADGVFQCISVVNMVEPATVTVNVTDSVLQVVCESLKENVGIKVATSIDLSGFESAGTIVETYADGSSKTTTMEFDANGNPTKITDSDGNVTVLTW